MKTVNILLFFKNNANLSVLTEVLNKKGFTAISASDYEQFDCIMVSGTEISMIIADISGFDQNIWQRLQKAKEHSVPFLVISPRQDFMIQKESISHGATGIMIKPVVIKDLLRILAELMD